MTRPTVNHLNLSAQQTLNGVTSAQQTQRTSRLSAIVHSARGILSTLTSSRKKHRGSTTATPSSSHLEPPRSLEHVWKLLPSQRQQLCELYHRHHELTDSFWGIYNLVHASSISVSPPALVEALTEVGVRLPRESTEHHRQHAGNDSGIFLSEFQFLRVVEGIMTDPKHEQSYYEDDKRLVELALDSNAPESPRSNELWSHNAADDSKISVSRLSNVLRQYELEAPHRAPHSIAPATPPPAFLVAALQQDIAGSTKKAHRKSVAPSRLDVPEHVSLDMLCSALNRATLATPDPLSDFRCAQVRGDVAHRTRGASLLTAPRVPPRLSVASAAMEGSYLAASFASSGQHNPTDMPPIALDVPPTNCALDTSRNITVDDLPAVQGSPRRKWQKPQKAIPGAVVADVPLPPLKKKPGLWETTGQGTGLRRHDSLDALLRTTMESCVEVTHVMEKKLLKHQSSSFNSAQHHRYATAKHGPLASEGGIYEVHSMSDVEEDFSETSSAGSQRRHNAEQRFGAYNVFVSGTFTPPPAVVLAGGSLPPLSPIQTVSHNDGEQRQDTHRGAKYRKPWLEGPSGIVDEDRLKRRQEERKVKESHKIGMDALIAEIQGLTVAERRALTPSTRRMVTIARSASSIGESHRPVAQPYQQVFPRSDPVPLRSVLHARWTTGGL